MSIAATDATATTVTHFHVHVSFAGCLPEGEPYVTDDASLALDALAHMMADWSQTGAPDDRDAVYAAAVAETSCTCPERDRSAEHRDALALLERGQGLYETAGSLEFEITVCRERDCLKYCPEDDCRTIAPVGDLDARCWCCGADYVPWDACHWLT